MTEAEVLEAMNIGASQIAEDCDFIVVGEMGIGNTTTAAALCMARFGGDAPRWVGPGTGLDDDGVTHKAKIIEQALETQGKLEANPVALLAGFGGPGGAPAGLGAGGPPVRAVGGAAAGGFASVGAGAAAVSLGGAAIVTAVGLAGGGAVAASRRVVSEGGSKDLASRASSRCRRCAGVSRGDAEACCCPL